MRILTFTNMYPTPERPIHGTFVAEQVASLRRRGLDVDVLFVDGPRSRWNYLRGIKQLRDATLAKPYDLIHAHYVFCGVMALAERTLLGSRRLPLVLTHHGIEAQVGWTAPLCRWTARRADATIATSPRVAGALALPGVEILPCGVDSDLFRPMPRAAARAELGLDAQTPLILFVGAPRPEKRLSLIRAAITVLQVHVPAAQLVLVHDAPRERIPRYMNACDVLVLASLAEGAPMVVREALACNLPLVSTDVGDVRELCDDLPGHFIADATPEALAEALCAALAFGKRTDGRTRVLQWSLNAVAERLEALYRKAL